MQTSGPPYVPRPACYINHLLPRHSYLSVPTASFLRRVSALAHAVARQVLILMSTSEGVSSAPCVLDSAAINITRTSSPDDGKPTASKTDLAAAVSSPPSPVIPSGESPDPAQPVSWLTLGGFHPDGDSPAALEVYRLQERRQSQFESDTDSSKSDRTFLASTTILHDAPGTALQTRGAPPPPSPGADTRSQASTLEQRYGCGLRHHVFQHLVESARQMLTDSARSDAKACSRSNTEGVGQDCPTEAVYSLRDVDLERIVVHVVRVLDTLHHANIRSLRDPDRQDRPEKGESSGVSKAILPQAPKEADTATTITVPQTYITPACWEKRHPVPPDEQPRMSGARRTTTILVSHNAIESTAEISWSTRSPLASVSETADHLVARHVSSDLPSQGGGYPFDTTDTGGQERNIQTSVDSANFHPQDHCSSRLASTVDTACRAHFDSYPPAKPSIGSSKSSIVSFPALQRRHCTNDWLSPPAATPAAMGRSETNLYNVGVDAHTGPHGFFACQPAAERPVAGPGARNADDLSFTPPAWGSRHGPAPPDDRGNHKSKVGASIGTSAGRRLSNYHAAPPDAEAASSSVLQKLRRGSVQFGHALASAVKGAAHAQQPQRAGRGRRASSADQMKAILDRASPPPRRPTDAVGLLRVGMVSSSEAGRGDRDACSEDGRPHVCMFDAASSIGSP